MAFKDYYDGDCARVLGELLLPHAPGFDIDGYAAEVDSRVGPLELKDRVLTLAHGLRERLDPDYEVAIDTLLKALPDPIYDGKGMYTDSWALSPVARFVEEFGLAHPETSLAALELITTRHTGEFAIRPYLREHHELTMQAVRRWTESPDLNVRRLASEGIRTRLPWAAHYQPFKDDPAPLIETITPLINDPSRYVRTSVANNLNDISKDNPHAALTTARDWLGRSGSAETRWIVTKGLRTLVKAGAPEALALIGAEQNKLVSTRKITITPSAIGLGDTALIEVEIANNSTMAQYVIVDYRMHFRKKNGVTRPTTFKLRNLTVAPGATTTVQKRHTFRPVTTRTYYPGMQGLSVQVNGLESERIEFELRQG